MSETLREIIDCVQDSLEETLETEYGLLEKLLSSGVITSEHKVAIEVVKHTTMSFFVVKLCCPQGRVQDYLLESKDQRVKIEAEFPKAESGVGFLGRGAASQLGGLGSL